MICLTALCDYAPPAVEVTLAVVEHGFAASGDDIVSDGFEDGATPDLNEWD